MNEPLCFMYEYKGIAYKLKMPIGIKASGKSFPQGAALPWVGLWDTGATCSMISQKIVDELGLKPRDYITVSTASSTYKAPNFYVDILLPNRLLVNHLLTPLGKLPGCDLLIGMDIISQGDFAVSNFGDRTSFTYRVPSIARIDFAKEEQDKRAKT